MNEVQKESAQEALARLGIREARPYSTYDFGRERDEGCLSVVVPAGEAEALVWRLRDALGPGLVAFVGTSQWLGDETHEEGAEVAVGPGGSQLDILRLARSDAANYDMYTEDLVAKLGGYDEEFGIDITHAETDTILFNLVGWPADLAAFARDLYEFCPDIVDQGVGSVEELREVVEATGKVALWWD